MPYNRATAHSLPSGEIISSGYELKDHIDLVLRSHQSQQKF